MVKISKVTVEHHESGLGIDAPRPRLSWRFELHPDRAQVDAEDRNWEQVRYDIEIVSPEPSGGASKTNTYSEQSDRSVLVPWPVSCAPLRSRDRCVVRVKAFGNNGTSTEWSEPVQLEMGLVERADWKVPFITSDRSSTTEGNRRPIYLRRRFSTRQQEPYARARLYITARGLYECYVNGKRVSDHVLAPGWQSYRHRLAYQTFDVTSLLSAGSDTTIGVIVAEGWYSGRLGFQGGISNIWGDRLGALVQFEIDGKVVGLEAENAETDWTWSHGPIIDAQLYDGETFDASLVDPDWCTSRSSDRERTESDQWRSAETMPCDAPQPSINQAPPMRRTQEVRPIGIITTPSGKTILDMGQNMVGWLRWNSNGPRADLNGKDSSRSLTSRKVSLRHAEVLEHGELGSRPLRHAAATDTVLLDSNFSMKGYEPSFTFHGFRYVLVTGWPDVTLDDFTGIVIHTDMERLGTFHCSHDWLNRLHENVVWGMRGNFLSVPTDCPQRDERLGWTGDIQVFAPTAAFLYETTGILGDWLQDVRSEQIYDLNDIPSVVTPNILETLSTKDQGAFAIWGDVVVLTPFDLYQASADDQILKRQWDSLQAWLERGIVRDPDTDLWHPDNLQLGDWLDPMAPPECAAWGQTHSVLVADAYLVHVTRIASQIAAVLDHSNDAQRYGKQAERLLEAFSQQWISPNGMLTSESQCALALALHFRLEGPGDRGQARRAAWCARLDKRIRSQGFKISTGFAGTPIMLNCLADAGLTHLAYRMLQEKQCPSWLYPISVGATTCWERWDSMLPDGSINPGEMTSFNHFALGSVAHFLHSQMGGLVIEKPGWKMFRIRPRPGGTVSSCAVSHITPYGRAACSWKVQSATLVVEVEVPPNTRAIIDIPGHKVHEVGSGTRRYVVDYQADIRWPPKVHQLNYSAPLLDEFVQ